MCLEDSNILEQNRWEYLQPIRIRQCECQVCDPSYCGISPTQRLMWVPIRDSFFSNVRRGEITTHFHWTVLNTLRNIFEFTFSQKRTTTNKIVRELQEQVAQWKELSLQVFEQTKVFSQLIFKLNNLIIKIIHPDQRVRVDIFGDVIANHEMVRGAIQVGILRIRASLKLI